MASMVASMASMVLMAPRATMETASAAMKASKAGAPVLRWSKLGNKPPLHHQPFYENSSNIWLVSTTIMAMEDDGPRCSRRVGDDKVKKELMGCHSWALVGGVDGWRRWMASMFGVDGGLGSSTQRALTWKSFCVPSGGGDTHSGSLLVV